MHLEDHLPNLIVDREVMLTVVDLKVKVTIQILILEARIASKTEKDDMTMTGKEDILTNLSVKVSKTGISRVILIVYLIKLDMAVIVQEVIKTVIGVIHNVETDHPKEPQGISIDVKTLNGLKVHVLVIPERMIELILSEIIVEVIVMISLISRGTHLAIKSNKTKVLIEIQINQTRQIISAACQIITNIILITIEVAEVVSKIIVIGDLLQENGTRITKEIMIDLAPVHVKKMEMPEAISVLMEIIKVIMIGIILIIKTINFSTTIIAVDLEGVVVAMKTMATVLRDGVEVVVPTTKRTSTTTTFTTTETINLLTRI